MARINGGYTVKQWNLECKAGKHTGRVGLPNQVRWFVLDKYNRTCVVCGDREHGKMHIDHKIPLALGGTNVTDNLWVLCATCNTSKGARRKDS